MKNIQNFKSFVEVLESKKKINYDDINIDDYDYEKGEIVTLKHPTWREQYDFTVTVPGKNPTLRQIDGPREIILDRPKTFGLVAPKKLVDEYLEKNKKEKEIKPKSKKSMVLNPDFFNIISYCVLRSLSLNKLKIPHKIYKKSDTGQKVIRIGVKNSIKLTNLIGTKS